MLQSTTIEANRTLLLPEAAEIELRLVYALVAHTCVDAARAALRTPTSIPSPLENTTSAPLAISWLAVFVAPATSDHANASNVSWNGIFALESVNSTPALKPSCPAQIDGTRPPPTRP